MAADRGGGGGRAPRDRARPGPHRARGRRRRRPASSTRTCRSSPTPSCSPTSSPASAPARAPLPPGRAALPTSSASGPTCRTPTCGSEPQTSARSASRCCSALTGQTARQMTGPGCPRRRATSRPPRPQAWTSTSVTGVVLAQGSPTSHAAILARARDIPVVVAAGPEVLSIPEGTTDRPRRRHGRAARRSGAGAGRGVPSVGPPRPPQQRARQLALADQPAVSRDGTRIRRGRQPRIRRRRAGRARGRGRRRRSGAHRVPLPRPDRRSRHRGAAGSSTTRSPRRWTVGESPCEHSTSAATSHCPTCRCRRRPTRSSAGAAYGSASTHRDLLRDQMAAICHTARQHPDEHHDPDGVDARAR